MTYTVRRKADRLAMAKELSEIAHKYGSACEVDPDGKTVNVAIQHPSGLAVTVWLTKDVQPDVHVIPWHIKYDYDVRLSPAFGDVNPYHFHKATHVRRGWLALAAEIERGLSAATDGSAFQTKELA